MYSLLPTKEFRKSLKRVRASGTFKTQGENALATIITTLVRGENPPIHNRDHQLKGELSEYRECHIKGDLLLVYRLDKSQNLIILVEIGSHSYLNL